MTTVAIAIMAVLLAVLIGNTLPSFTVPAIKTLTKSKNGIALDWLKQRVE